jgi:hypothetical protein
VIAAIAAFVAWLGASAIVLADGRRGLASGLGLVAAGLAGIEWQGGDGSAAGILLVGGGIATLLRLRSGAPGWTIMPAGSTPRLILCVAGGLLALWFAASVTFGSGAAARYGVFSVVGLSGVRALYSRETSIVMTATAAMSLAIAAGASLAGSAPGPLPFVAAALIAAGMMALPSPAAHAS